MVQKNEAEAAIRIIEDIIKGKVFCIENDIPLSLNEIEAKRLYENTSLVQNYIYANDKDSEIIKSFLNLDHGILHGCFNITHYRPSTEVDYYLSQTLIMRLDIRERLKSNTAWSKAEDSEPTETVISEEKKECYILRKEIDTPRARMVFDKALENKYMVITKDGRFKWLFGGKRGKVRLGYMLHKIYRPKGIEDVPEQSLNDLFGVTSLSQTIYQVDGVKRKQSWREDIDKLFEGIE
ncbi:MAG: hypothetical protein LIP09_08025 [Bacteroidales bacterium]|nr:hypothetical protein [Bacteroidales bacterium]